MRHATHRPPREYESFAAQGFSNYDVIDPRIDVSAQKALIRLRGNPATASDAAGMLNAVKGGRLQGIYGDDLLAAAQLAARRGTVRWELVPRGRDAALVPEYNPYSPPTIIFRTNIRNDSARLDRALLSAWGEFAPPLVIAIPHRQFGILWSVSRGPAAAREAESFAPRFAQSRRAASRDDGEAQTGPPPPRVAPLRTIVPDTTVAPWRWICSLEIDWGNDPGTGLRLLGSSGTGVLISPRHVLTAGHNIVNFELIARTSMPGENLKVPKRMAVSITVIPGRNSMGGRPAPFGVFAGMRKRVSHGWDQYLARGFDYGLITLNGDVAGMNYWGSPARSDGVSASIRPVTRGDLAFQWTTGAGYPGDKCGPLPPAGSASAAAMTACKTRDEATFNSTELKRVASTQWRANGRVRGFDDDGRLIEMRFMGTTGGQSGSPVWVGTAQSPNLVGIHVSSDGRTGDDIDGLSYAVHLTPQVVEQLRAWVIEDGVHPSF